MEKEARDRKNPLRVVVSSKERQLITANAKNANLSVSAFLRNLGMGFQPKSTFDQDAIHELVKLHADQGRLGGLLKLWLTDRKGEGANASEVRSVLLLIESLQIEIAKLVMAQKKRL
jgi:hypothetical protein